MSETQNEVRTPAAPGALLGLVKWFNNNDGYGFVTVLSEGESKGSDIFAHQSNIYPLHSGYRTLRPGEYVSFNLSDEERPQAVDLTGVLGGPLQCDTQILLRNARKEARANQSGSQQDETAVVEGEQSENQSQGGRGRGGRGRRGRGRGGRGRGGRGASQNQSTNTLNDGGEGWTTVQ